MNRSFSVSAGSIPQAFFSCDILFLYLARKNVQSPRHDLFAIFNFAFNFPINELLNKWTTCRKLVSRKTPFHPIGVWCLVQWLQMIKYCWGPLFFFWAIVTPSSSQVLRKAFNWWSQDKTDGLTIRESSKRCKMPAIFNLLRAIHSRVVLKHLSVLQELDRPIARFLST